MRVTWPVSSVNVAGTGFRVAFRLVAVIIIIIIIVIINEANSTRVTG